MRRALWFLLGMGVVSAVAVAVTFSWWIEFSAFAAALLKVTLGAAAFCAFDVWVLRDVDTVEELKKGNVAYAVFLLGVAVLIAAAVASA